MPDLLFSHRRLRRRGALVVLLVAALAAAGMPPALGATRATRAPTGVWAGSADDPGDYGVLAIAKGPAGAQHTFYVEEMTGACGGTPGVFYGTSSFQGGVLSFSTTFTCADTGTEPFPGQMFELTLVRDPGADTWIFDDESYSPMTRRCGNDPDTAGPLTHEGTSGDDVLTGTSGNDVMDGKGGNDRLVGRGGIDILCGQKGKDVLKGGAGVDIMLGGGGNDKVIGGAGWDFGLGGGGKDTMKGNAGTDVLLGEAKPDRIIGGSGPNDVAIGGPGADTCDAETEISC